MINKKNTRFTSMMNDIMDGYDIFFSFIEHYGKDVICMEAYGLNKPGEVNRRYLNACIAFNQLFDEIEQNRCSRIQYRWTRKHPLKSKHILKLIQNKISYASRS